MPVKFELVGELYHVTFSGVLSVEDLARAGEEMKAMEASFDRTPGRIVDLSGLTAVSIGFDAISQLAEVRNKTPVRSPVKSALVAPGQLQMGFARMFQTLQTNPRIFTQVFRDRESALSWLALPLEPPPA